MSSAAEKLGMGNSKSSYASNPSYNTKPDASSLFAQNSVYQGSTKTSKNSSAAKSLLANNEVKSAATAKTSKNSTAAISELFANNKVKSAAMSQKQSRQNAAGLWGSN